ncbi:MAG: flavodoxin family protein, partial [Bacillota bacterium]|nr:flavodoxin family protein [Bacillota bacterium]
MKIVVINGSPKGINSNTNVMVQAFLKGAQEAGAETLNIFLSEKEIKHCKGCHICWTKGPGQCVTNDDMLGVLSSMGGANIIAFATPVYFANISGMLKVFMDRMTMIGSPHSQKDVKEKVQELKSSETLIPKLMMISNCGFP